MSVEPGIAAILEHLESATPMELMTIEQLRGSIVPPNLSARKPVRRIEDRSIADVIPVRIYEPLQRQGEYLLIYLHGGGFVLGSLESHADVARELCEAPRSPVVAVGYCLNGHSGQHRSAWQIRFWRCSSMVEKRSGALARKFLAVS